MKRSLRGLLASAFAALLISGCAIQQPGVVDRVPDGDAGRLLSQAEQQGPEQASLSRLEAANILAQQGQREAAFDAAAAVEEGSLSERDRVRWALLFSELARALDDPRAVLRATQVLDDELPMQGNEQQTLRERAQWARQALDEPGRTQGTPASLAGTEIRRIMVALPQSGPLSSIADTISSAMREHASIRGQGVELSFVDSTQYSMDELYSRAEQMNAQLLVGPLDKEQVTRLEQQPSVPMPTLALNYGNSAQNQASGLFQYGLSAEDEARQAANRAYQDGHRQMAVMVPDNDWGRRVGEAFWNEFHALGGEVSNAVRYNPSNDVSSAVQTALNVSGDRAQLGNVDALFLLALPEYARQVPPMMDFYYAPDLPIYATSHLFEGTQERRLNQDLNDVMFVDIPWQIPDAAVGGAEALPFYSSYQALQGEGDASLFRLQAMGVDAYELATRLSDLSSIQGFNGSTGTLSLSGDGRIHRELPWARFQNGRPAPILSPGLLGDQ
ncbi:penicillin-binding protein activator [Halomonas sp. HNIBRBA4712]|uniref:penicillin-binding protein activator n=1 Tax=Halomonas sp. HNIBRBA4712 TaxID=3373087 RepID=UPI003746ED99